MLFKSYEICEGECMKFIIYFLQNFKREQIFCY